MFHHCLWFLTCSSDDRYNKLARHFGWAFGSVFGSRGSVENIIVLEDDIEVSVDFFGYMFAMLPVLKQDPTLWTISAWNDNGRGARGAVVNEQAAISCVRACVRACRPAFGFRSTDPVGGCCSCVGRKHLVKDPTHVLRSDFFPGKQIFVSHSARCAPACRHSTTPPRRHHETSSGQQARCQPRDALHKWRRLPDDAVYVS